MRASVLDIDSLLRLPALLAFYGMFWNPKNCVDFFKKFLAGQRPTVGQPYLDEMVNQQQSGESGGFFLFEGLASGVVWLLSSLPNLGIE